MFVGREKELGYLEKEMEYDTFRMFVLYGRRRVGKTELLRQFTKGKRAVRFTGIAGDSRINMSKFAASVPLQYRSEKMNPDFEDILDSVVKMSKEERTILVIDEFPYLANSDKSITSRLQIYIDETMKDENILLILCGSSMGSMKDGVLGGKSPLYGRRTGQLELCQFDFRTSALMLERFSALDKFRIYSMVGGIPSYLSLFDPKVSIEENITKLFLDEISLLSCETEMLLQEEMRTPSAYSSLLAALSSGKTRISEIADCTQTSMSITSNQISNLIYIHIVERIQPFGNDSPKKTRYRICDNLFRFYYAFIYGNGSVIREDPVAFGKRICKEMNPYLGKSFEDVCRQYCRHYLGWYNTGTWWGTDERSKTTKEIDIVADSKPEKPGTMLFCECKYKSDRITMDEAEELITNSSLIPCPKKEYILFYATGKRPEDIDGMRIISLDEMYQSKEQQLNDERDDTA